MAQVGYSACSCCGRIYRSDGSEDDLYAKDHAPMVGRWDAVVLTENRLHCQGSNSASGDDRTECGFCAPTIEEVRKANSRKET